MKEKTLKFINHPLFSGTMLMVVGTNLVNGLNYIYHFLMGRFLGPAAYGELVSLFSIIGILGIVPVAMNLSITKFVSSQQEYSKIHSLIDYLQRRVIWVMLVAVLTSFALAPIIVEYLKLSHPANFILVSFILGITFSTFINRAVMQGLLLFPQIVFSSLIENLSKLLGGVGLVLLGWSVFGAMFALVLSGLISLGLSFYFIRGYLVGKVIDVPSLKPLFIYTFPVFLHQLFVTSMISSDIILVKYFFDPISAGNYSATSTLAKIIFFAASPVLSVMFPLVSSRLAKKQSFTKVFILSVLMTLAITVSLALLFVFFAPFAVWMLFGKGFGSASELLPLFSLFMILFSLNNLLIGFFLSVNKTIITVIPLLAAFFQVLFIFIFHNSLVEVLMISILTSALLLIILIVYSINERKTCFGYSSSVQTRKNNSKRLEKDS